MPQLMATIQHLKDGVKGFTVSAAVKNIQSWEEALGKVDGPAATEICSDLESLTRPTCRPTRSTRQSSRHC